MKFNYQARTKEGVMQVGSVEAGNRDLAAQILSGHDLFVLSIVSAEKGHWYDGIVEFSGRVRHKDLVIFTRQLATLLEARLALGAALKILGQQSTNKKLKEVTAQVAQDVDAGLSFSQALARQDAVFPAYYIELVRVAEVTGNLNDVAGFLADYTEHEGELATKAASALIYPGIIIGLFLVVGFILLTFVFPQIKPIFEESNVALPWYTNVFLTVGTFLQAWWIEVIIVFIFVVIALLEYLESNEGKALLDDLKIRVPILKKIYLPLFMARFGNSVALLMHGGVPLAQSLEIIERMIGNSLYEETIHAIAEDVRQGKLLSESLAQYPRYFPAIVPQMVAVGETTGKIEEMFNRLAAIYTREANQVMDNLVDLIQPSLMIVMGVMVGLLFASILIPLYRLTASIQ